MYSSIIGGGVYHLIRTDSGGIVPRVYPVRIFIFLCILLLLYIAVCITIPSNQKGNIRYGYISAFEAIFCVNDFVVDGISFIVLMYFLFILYRYIFLLYILYCNLFTLTCVY